MKKFVALFAALATVSSVAVFAAPPKSDKKAAKVTDLWTCPMTGEAIKDHKGTGDPVTVGAYRVHFCCAGCAPEFSKLSDKDKKAKVAELVKKDKAGAKSDKKG